MDINECSVEKLTVSFSSPRTRISTQQISDEFRVADPGCQMQRRPSNEIRHRLDLRPGLEQEPDNVATRVVGIVIVMQTLEPATEVPPQGLIPRCGNGLAPTSTRTTRTPESTSGPLGCARRAESSAVPHPVPPVGLLAVSGLRVARPWLPTTRARPSCMSRMPRTAATGPSHRPVYRVPPCCGIPVVLRDRVFSAPATPALGMRGQSARSGKSPGSAR